MGTPDGAAARRTAVELRRELGERLRTARTELGLARSHVAAQAGISATWLRSIESGHGAPSATVAEALVTAMALQGALADELRQAGVGRSARARSAYNPVRRLSLVPPSSPKAPPRNPTTLSDRMAVYRERLVRLEMSANTIKGYCSAVGNAEWWCEQQGYSLRNVPAIVLGQYVALRPKSHASRLILRAALTHYWACFKRKDPPLWMVKVPRKPKRVCRALPDEDAARVARHAAEAGGKAGLAVLLAMYQGFRREEISRIAWHDVTDDGWVKLIGKGDAPATLPLHPVVTQALAALPREHSVWVFPGRKNDKPVCPATIWSWICTLAKETGVEGVAPHVLRHTCLALANDVTGDLRAVQDFARHARPDTTAGYTRSTEKRLRAVLMALNYDPGAARRVEAEQLLSANVARLSDEDLSVIAQLVEELVAEASP